MTNVIQYNNVLERQIQVALLKVLPPLECFNEKPGL
jgi:hypothetical protein